MTQDLVTWLIDTVQVPLLIDADGLNAISSDQTELKKRPHTTILTPHPGELSRLMKRPIEDLLADRVGAAVDCSQKTGSIVVFKTASTVIAAPDGRFCVNTFGNAGLATAGTGDVLSGLIGGLLAQHKDPFEAACCGVLLHALAGDQVRETNGMHGLLATDLFEKIPLLLKSWEEDNLSPQIFF